jgi:protein-S-isoprenylcysteine O-methyltransferase Ste14
MRSDPPPPAIRFPPPLVWIGFLLLGYAADRAFGLPRFEFAAQKTLAALLILAATAMILWALASFRRAGERPEPWTGSEKMIEAGLYRITRNPMFLGMAASALGVALWFGSWAMLAAAALATLIIDRLVISREEAYLEMRFGDAYRAYRQRVRRWL